MPGQPQLQYSSPLHSERGPNNPVHLKQFMPVVSEMSTVTTQPDDWSDGSEYEDSEVDWEEWREHSERSEYEDSDVDWEEWKDHPDRDLWRDWQDAWMSQDQRCLEQDIHSSDTPIIILAKQRFKLEKIIETIHDHIDMERPSLRSALPELRNRGQRLLEEYMDSFTSLEDRRSNYRVEPGAEHEEFIGLLYQQRDDLVDAYNEMTRQSNTALLDLDWYEDEISSEMAPMGTIEQTGAHESSPLSAETDLKTKIIRLKSTETADFLPSENEEKSTGAEEMITQQADCSPLENAIGRAQAPQTSHPQRRAQALQSNQEHRQAMSPRHLQLKLI